MEPPATAPWWRQRSVAVLAGIVVAASLATVIAVAATGGGDSSESTSQATEQPSFPAVNSSLFPGVSQAEWEEAATTTCTRFKSQYRDRDISLNNIATYIRVSSREVIIRNRWHVQGGAMSVPPDELIGLEEALEEVTFEGPLAPCGQYSSQYRQAQSELDALTY
ncbi:hypothetical protein ACFQNE_02670 [Gordonia phosphorivorans]|uniref:Uncharacterized protein n=1 Tax=Gordonia phosphorivorans TaxID=1056982 RepID=A0ABV6H449_9ACTN